MMRESKRNKPSSAVRADTPDTATARPFASLTPETLFAALDGILRGEPPLSPAIAQRLLRVFNAPPEPLHAGAEQLTAREREVAAQLMQGLTSKEIGRALGISHRTVEIYRARLMRKYGANTTADLVHKLVGAS